MKTSPIAKFFSRLAGAGGHSPLATLSLLVLMAALPIAVWPTFIDPHAAIKQLLLVICVALGLFGFALHLYRQRAYERPSSWWVWLPAALIPLVAISAARSSSGYLAWVGGGSQAFTTVCSTAALVLLYLLVIHAARTAHVLRALMAGLFAGTAVALLVSVLELFGVSLISGTHGFAGFSTTSTLQSVALLGVVCSVLGVGMWVMDGHVRTDAWMPNPAWRTGLSALTVVNTVLTVVILASAVVPVARMAALIATGLYIAFALHRPSKFQQPKRMLVVIGLFALALLSLAAPSFLGERLPREVTPSPSESYRILQQTWQDEGWLFGSGPGTYTYDYEQYRNPAINQTVFWNVSFDHSGWHLATLLTTWGLLPVVVLALFAGWCAVRLGHALLVKHNREDWQLVALVGSVWAALVLASCVYASDIVLTSVLWVLTGVLVARLVGSASVRIGEDDRASLVSGIGFVAAGIAVFVITLSSVQLFLGEAVYASAERAARREVSAEQIAARSQRAARLNRWHAGYARSAALTSLALANERAQTGAEEDAVFATARVAMEEAQRAVRLEPRDARNHEVVRVIAMALIPSAAGMDRLAVDAATAAVQTAPTSPATQVRLAESLLVMAQRAELTIVDAAERDQVVAAILARAEQAATQAIALRPQLAEAYYMRTLIYDAQGRLTDAIAELERLVAASPRDAVARFELGVVRLRAGQLVQARQDFEAAVTLAPTYANAKWYLASVYESEGEIEAAIIQLQDLLILDPNNTRVAQKLELLQAGETSATPPESVQPL